MQETNLFLEVFYVKYFIGMVLIVFALNACVPITNDLGKVIKDCVFDILAKDASQEAFNACIKSAGVEFTGKLTNELTKELLGFSEEALNKIFGTIMSPAVPGEPLPALPNKKATVDLLVRQIKEISEEK